MSLFPEGYHAIVTGGSQGLGFAAAAEMLRQGLDGVVIVGRNAEKGERARKELANIGGDVVFVADDLAQLEAAPRIVAEAAERFGPVHCLVNAAAMTDRDTVWDVDPAVFDRMFAVNVRAPLLLTQGVVRNMKEHGVKGSIVNIGSVAGHGGPSFIASYSASKGALLTLTRNLANSLSAHQIRVNIINPGWMDTPAEDVIQKKYHDAADDWVKEAGTSQPFGRLIHPDEVARLIAHLASPASGLMTGAVIDFDQKVWVGALPGVE